MDNVAVLLMLIGLLSILIFVILLVISFFRKTSKCKWIIGILISALVFSLGSIFFLRNELLQKQDLESRMGKSTLSERDIIDSELLDCAKNAFSEIGITEDLKFEVVRDEETVGIRDIELLTLFNSIKMKFISINVDGEWHPVSIQDYENKKYYWLADDIRKYGDIYDWKTGKVINKQTSTLPAPVENFKKQSEEVLKEAKEELHKLRKEYGLD